MGYFSNGTERELYREKWCEQCVHDVRDEAMCPVWTVHLMMQSYSNADLKWTLDQFIPYGTIENGKCQMFREQ